MAQSERNYYACLPFFADRRFVLRQKEAQSAFNFPASETRQARQEKLKNKLLMRCIFDVEK